MTHAGTVTLLFTDIVNSTELLHRAGDESAQRVFEAHHKLLSARSRPMAAMKSSGSATA